MIAFDTTFLTLMFFPGAPHPISDAKARVEFLISDIHGRGDKILVPTPALAEILIKSGRATNAILQELTKSSKFEIAPFDFRSALELSLMTDAALTKKDKRGGATGTWAKVKFDRQIVSIAKVSGVTTVYSEDQELRKLATDEGLSALSVRDIKIPEPLQSDFWRKQ